MVEEPVPLADPFKTPDTGPNTEPPAPPPLVPGTPRPLKDVQKGSVLIDTVIVVTYWDVRVTSLLKRVRRVMTSSFPNFILKKVVAA